MKIKRIFLTAIFLFITISTFFSKEYSASEAKKLRSEIVAKAKTYVGAPYKLGAIGPNEFDCSGLIFTTFREAAFIQLPRSVKALYSFAKIVPFSELEEGDLIFFHTGGDKKINHAGIYIGRNQFIHAASDGANSGVIVSSLNEKYYKNVYAAVGKPLSSAKEKKTEEEILEEEIPDENFSSSKKNDEGFFGGSIPKSKNDFFENIVFDATTSCDWNLWLPKEFLINFRGITLTTVARYAKGTLQPGVGTTLRWNYGTSCFQLPILFTLNFNDYVGIYIGPVITFGNPSIPKDSTKIVGSFFPGIMGVSFSTPQIKIGKIGLSFCQDFLYTVFNQKDGGALSFGNSLQSGFVFSTGVKISLPLKNFIK